MKKRQIETRIIQDAELRAVVVEGATPKITGYAAVWDSPSQDLGGFTEVIHKGAFTKTMQERDIKALWNHNPDLVLGSTKAGTLKIEEDQRGLRYEITPPASASNYVESIQRGDVDGSSFQFRAIKDQLRSENGATVRHIYEVQLIEVSPTAFPAYSAATSEVALRSILDKYGVTWAELDGLLSGITQLKADAAKALEECNASEPTEQASATEEPTDAGENVTVSVLNTEDQPADKAAIDRLRKRLDLLMQS